MSLLKVEQLQVHYGAIEAVKGISFDVSAGDLITLIGANGAGKTSTIRAISGEIPIAHGDVKLDGRSIARLPVHERVALGIGVVPEGRRVFAPLTVEDNLTMGTFGLRDRKQLGTNEEMVFELFPRLKERRRQAAGTLSGGEQQMLALGRALMGSPRLLLMDEPSLGLAPLVVEHVFEKIKEMNCRGITVLLAEQNAQMALEIASYGHVLEIGKISLHAPASDLLLDERVAAAYLGG